MLEERSAAALLLVLALPTMLPFANMGLSLPFGVLMILISVQLMLGRRRAWIPAVLARQTLPRPKFLAVVERIVPLLRRLEKAVRPRATPRGTWLDVPVGVLCLILSIIVTLPVPFGNIVPGAAITVLALGLLERDGVAVALGLVIALLGIALIGTTLLGAVNVLENWWP